MVLFLFLKGLFPYKGNGRVWGLAQTPGSVCKLGFDSRFDKLENFWRRVRKGRHDRNNVSRRFPFNFVRGHCLQTLPGPIGFFLLRHGRKMM